MGAGQLPTELALLRWWGVIDILPRSPLLLDAFTLVDADQSQNPYLGGVPPARGAQRHYSFPSNTIVVCGKTLAGRFRPMQFPLA
jgi:hypothetical protein